MILAKRIKRTKINENYDLIEQK